MLKIGPWLEFLWENPQDSTAGLYQNLLLHQNNFFYEKDQNHNEKDGSTHFNKAVFT